MASSVTIYGITLLIFSGSFDFVIKYLQKFKYFCGVWMVLRFYCKPEKCLELMVSFLPGSIGRLKDLSLVLQYLKLLMPFFVLYCENCTLVKDCGEWIFNWSNCIYGASVKLIFVVQYWMQYMLVKYILHWCRLS